MVAMLHELLGLFKDQEPVPFIMLALACVGIVIILERVVLLQIVYRVNFNKFNQNLRKMLAAGDLERARTFCVATSKVGVPHIAVKAIDAFQTDSFKVRMVVTEEFLSFLPRLRRRLSQLPSLATVTVFLGALAAVHGIWAAFRASNVLDFTVKHAALTAGLSGAFTPLVFSLIVCVALLLPYGLLDAAAGKLESDVEHSLTMILNILAPETSTVITQQSFGGGEAPMQAASDAPPAATTESKGNYEEVITGENAPVLDEEEII